MNAIPSKPVPAGPASASTAAAAESGGGDAWTIGRLLQWTREHLLAKGVEDPRLCAELLLAHALDCQRIQLYARFDQSPGEDQRAAFRELVRGAAGHRPIAYLIGRKEFYSLEFQVTPDVLIPRPETELIVECALAWCKPRGQGRIDVLDVGTGSGCIAVSVARREPRACVLATDVSEPALEVAADNARRHGVEERIQFQHADLLDLPAERRPADGFDLILSNPPYIPGSQRDALPANVRDHEPPQALFGGGADGLDAYRRMAAQARPLLKPDGMIIVEIGAEQDAAVGDIFTRDGRFRAAGRHKDAAGWVRTLSFELIR